MITRQEIYRVDGVWFNGLLGWAQEKAHELLGDYENGKNHLLSALDEEIPLEEIKNTAALWQDKDLVFVGIGGSILSPNLFRPFAKTKTNITYMTAPDSVAIEKLLASIDISKTRFVILSKSGKTTETIAIFLRLLAWLAEKNVKACDMMLAVCENNDNPLHNLCKKNAIPCFYADENIDSRFSLWTPIGLLPAYLFGLDGAEIRRGAQAYVKDFFDKIKKNERHPLLSSSAWHLFGEQSDRNINVMIHNDERLAAITLWWQQLFAESLGKDKCATTPLIAKLPEDLHIRFQLYLDGPNDKIFTLLTMPPQPSPTRINTYGEKNLAWLEGSSLNQLLAGQENNAHSALMRARRSVRVLALEDFSEKAYGALTAHFVLEILLAAKMWNVQAFGQPAIETGKKELQRFIEETKYAV